MYEWGHTVFLPTFWWLMARIYWDSTQFLPKHLLQPKGFFLASTRGVYMCLRLSSQFSALSLGLRGIPLSAALSGECCSSQDSMSWALGDVNFHGTKWHYIAFSPPWNLASVLSRNGESTSKEVSMSTKGFCNWEPNAVDIISIFLCFLQ